MEKECPIHAPFLMDLLRELDAEETGFLSGVQQEKRIFFTSGAMDTIDWAKMPHPDWTVSLVRHPRFAPVPRHRHNFIELMYVCNGTVVHVINGKRVILSPGDILMLNQYTSHAVEAAGLEDIAVNVIIQPRFFDDIYEQAGKRTTLSDFIVSLIRDDMNCDQYLHYRTTHHLPIRHLMEILLCDNFPYEDGIAPRQGENNAHLNARLMDLLFYYLSRDLSGLYCDSPMNYDQVMLSTVNNYIEEQYATATLEELASMMNQSESTLSRQIKAVSGSTFKELLQAKRFRRAILLLRETNLAVSDIALAVGYENSSYFYRRFREIHHMSPKSYREQFRT